MSPKRNSLRANLRIGTRGSQLALAQANEAKQALEKAHPGLTCELVILKTSGDDFTGGLYLSEKGQSPWNRISGGDRAGTVPGDRAGTVPVKGLFVKEIEEALLEGRIDLAVHSVKDLQAELPAGLRLAAILPRQDPRDALVARGGGTVKDLPEKTTVGASSLRRQAQLKRLRADLEPVPIRGNVDTRLKKLEAGECGALLLAACGLIRLGLQDRISERISTDQMLPAPGQGALGIQVREEDREVVRFVEAVNDPDSDLEVKAERALLKALGGGCQVPMGALAKVQGENLSMSAVVLSPDGRKAIREQIVGSAQAAEKLGKDLASHLRAAGADRLLYGSWAEKKG